MPKINFTRATLDALTPPTRGRTYYNDRKVRGLQCVVTSSGVKSFYLYCKVRGRPERMLIGRFPAIGVDDARRAADKLRGEIAQGGNPADRKRAERSILTLGELWDVYIDRAKREKRTWKSDEYRYNAHLSHWKNRRLDSISKADVAVLHATLGQSRPYEANRALAQLSCMFNRAGDFGFAGPNPCKGVKRWKEVKRDRFLQPAELKAFFATLNDPATPALWRHYFSLAILTGARRGNLMSMRWDAIDLDRGLWQIPGNQSKSGEPLIVILVPDAVAILRERRQANPTGEWVFSSFGASGHLTETKSGWTDVCQRAGLSDVRPHDLRRTYASWQAILGASTTIIGQSIGHQPGSSATAVYSRLNQDAVRRSVEAGTSKMLELAGVNGTAKGNGRAGMAGKAK